jgi:hypothetical protein
MPLRPLCLALAVALAVTSPVLAQVPSQRMDNPVAGFTLTAPMDWEYSTARSGATMIALDAEAGALCLTHPALWFIRSKKSPQAEAQGIARGLKALTGKKPQLTRKPNGDWEAAGPYPGALGPVSSRWLCRREGTQSYILAGFLDPQRGAAQKAAYLQALATFHLIPRVAQKSFTEPTERAYKMALPTGWTWQGKIYRDVGTPGYFTWIVRSANGASGAFCGAPASFNISQEYLPAGEVAEDWMQERLQGYARDVRLEQVQPLERVGEYARACLKAFGLGGAPRADKVRADYRATIGGVPVRIRVVIGTYMLDQSAILGGRGNWSLVSSGNWAPVAKWAQGYPLGRAVTASVVAQKAWNDAMRGTARDVVSGRRDATQTAADRFVNEYINQ